MLIKWDLRGGPRYQHAAITEGEVESIIRKLEALPASDLYRSNNAFCSLKVELILILAKFGYPPISRDEVYQEIFDQAENFKANKVA